MCVCVRTHVRACVCAYVSGAVWRKETGEREHGSVGTSPRGQEGWKGSQRPLPLISPAIEFSPSRPGLLGCPPAPGGQVRCPLWASSLCAAATLLESV